MESQAEQQAQKKMKEEQEAFERRLKCKIESDRQQEEAAREKAVRKENPYFTRHASGDYEGINVNSGEILRMQGVQKIGKDETGRYLYSGYLGNTSSESNAWMLDQDGIPSGVPVCFSIDKRVEDIVAENNPAEIRQLLQLLSQEDNFRNNNGYMNYIGALDRNGNVTRGVDNSPALQNRINQLKQQAYAQYVQKRSQEQDGFSK